MMGAGKSSVGRALSELGGREFWDTDLMLQNRLGRPISQIFQVYGEDAFRDHETSILRSLEPGDAVISTGGGIVLRDANWEEMRRLGTTIYLEASPETLIARLESSKKKRPLLQVEEWPERLRELLGKREPLYKQADVTVLLDGLDVVPPLSASWKRFAGRDCNDGQTLTRQLRNPLCQSCGGSCAHSAWRSYLDRHEGRGALPGLGGRLASLQHASRRGAKEPEPFW